MANYYKRKRFTVITIVYWFLLIYIITALLFWLLSLLRQNTQMAEYKILQLKKDEPGYVAQVEAIQMQEKTKVAQYIGEGATFMLLILVGAVFVYRATRRQIRLNNQQQNFMMAVTHELKTPIAVTKLNLETLIKRKLEEHQREKLINNTLQEANRLNTLCDNILVASQLDAGRYLFTKETLNLSDLLSDSISNFEERFPERHFKYDIEKEIFVTGDALLLQLAANNLIDNAIKYSAKDKTVTIALKKQGAKAVLEIIDEGEGIRGQEKTRVFEKFYRSGSESTRRTKGTGLGLFLTKKIITDHKGTIKVIDNNPSGCIFVCTLAVI
ncbi:MAG: two-component sensor histidine kinase [Chitinophagaceae bacterium]|nr:two-component sensor histidine kinase [Chitinophagaceae bacterium]MCW5929338.1 two-component sensor histidine kinase [Chitinophagaceae bacterium]